MRHPTRPALRLAVLAALFAAPSGVSAAPLHPDLVRTADPAVLAAIPPEPGLVEAPETSAGAVPGADPGILGAAWRSGRRWTGHPRLLVLLVDFPDRPGSPGSRTPEDIDRLLFGQGTGDSPSLRDYYLEVSQGRIDVTGEVKGWFRMPLARTTYADGASGLGPGFPGNARGLADHALRAALDAGVDFTRFDNDGPDGIPGSGDDDGILDGLVLVQAGLGTERTGNLDDFRSHVQSTTSVPDLGAVAAPDYMLIPSEENVGVAVHEFGHILGGEDLYDESGRAWGLGWYSVMATSMWFRNATAPGGPDAYTRILWGLATPDILGADEPRIDLPDIHDSPVVLRLWTHGAIGREYFLVENRRPHGVDALVPGDGLLVYHVDTSVSRQRDRHRYRVAVVQADGFRSLEVLDGPPNGGEPGDFFPGLHDVRRWDDTTRPSTRSNDGEPTGLALRILDGPGPVIRVAAEVGRKVAGGPAPRLVLRPEGGYLDGRPAPGGSAGLHVVLENRGTRLRAGTLRFRSPDPRVTLTGAEPVAIPSVGALGRLVLPEPLVVAIDPGAGASAMPLLLEALWEGDGDTRVLPARIPLEGDVRFRDDFETERTDVVPYTLREGSADWRRLTGFASAGVYGWGAGGRGGYPARMDAVLELPAVEVGPAGVLRFAHLLLVSPPTGTAALDGGFVEISTDDGAHWSVAEPEGGYPARFDLTDGNPYPGTPAWAGFENRWQEATVPLPPGRLSVRFHFVSDYSASPADNMGWFVDDVLVESAEGTHAAYLHVEAIEADAVRLAYRVVPVTDPPVAAALRVIQEGPGETLVLGDWNVTGERAGTLVAPGLRPGNRYRYRLELPHAVTPDREAVIPAAAAEPFRVPDTVSRWAGAWIEYRVAIPGDVTLDVFDVSGRRAARWVDAPRAAGWHRLPWPGRTDAGRALAPGVYFLRLDMPGGPRTRRVVVLP